MVLVFLFVQNFLLWEIHGLFFLHEVVYAINKTYKSLISWLEGNNMQIVMMDFKTWCGLIFVQGAID